MTSLYEQFTAHVQQEQEQKQQMATVGGDFSLLDSFVFQSPPPVPLAYAPYQTHSIDSSLLSPVASTTSEEFRNDSSTMSPSFSDFDSSTMAVNYTYNTNQLLDPSMLEIPQPSSSSLTFSSTASASPVPEFDLTAALTPPQSCASPASLSSPLPEIKKEASSALVVTPDSPALSSSSPGVNGPPSPPEYGKDWNGRKPRKWKNRKYKCSHCNLSFLDKDLDLYAEHVQQVEQQPDGIKLTRRRYKCADETCPWHKIGFLRKLEAQKHYTRKHGVPKFECRFWCEEGEKYPGCGVCTTRWHADSGNRSRHEQAIHGRAFHQ